MADEYEVWFGDAEDEDHLVSIVESEDADAPAVQQNQTVTSIYVAYLRAEILQLRASGGDLIHYTSQKVIDFCSRFDLEDIYAEASERNMVDARIRVICRRARNALKANGGEVPLPELDKLERYKSNPNFGRF